MSKKHRPAPEKKPDKEQETPLVPAEAAEQAEALPEHKTEPEAVPEITETDEALNEIIDEVLGETAQPESTAEAVSWDPTFMTLAPVDPVSSSTSGRRPPMLNPGCTMSRNIFLGSPILSMTSQA